MTTPSPQETESPAFREALIYVDRIKLHFQETPNVYKRFLDILQAYQKQLIDTPRVIERISDLFAGNPELIQDFNVFLPQRYRTQSSGPSESKPRKKPVLNDALTYLNHVETRFNATPRVYQDFLDILRNYQTQQ
ncbi:MAG: hypothetical protein Q9213_003035 [Squamulea squamosa]